MMAPLLEEEENYIRLALLLKGVSPRAVRTFFDKEFPPTYLPSTLNKNYNTLYDLFLKRILNQAQWHLLFTRNGVPDSKAFDVTLMICLIRNLTSVNPPINGFDYLPLPGETTPGPDLARIKWYRNILAHHDSNTMPTCDFNTAWRNVADELKSAAQIGNIEAVKFTTKLDNLIPALTILEKQDVRISHVETRQSKEFKDCHDFTVVPTTQMNGLQTVIYELKKISKCVTIVGEDIWIPIHVSDLDRCVDKVLSAWEDLEADHPGFTDAVYRKRRKYFADIALDYKHGDSIPRVENTEDEVKTWEFLEAFPLLEQKCGYSADNIKQVEDFINFLRDQIKELNKCYHSTDVQWKENLILLERIKNIKKYCDKLSLFVANSVQYSEEQKLWFEMQTEDLLNTINKLILQFRVTSNSNDGLCSEPLSVVNDDNEESGVSVQIGDGAFEEKFNFAKQQRIECQMCIDQNNALYWCKNCKMNICSFCKMYHETVWTVMNHDVHPLSLLS